MADVPTQTTGSILFESRQPATTPLNRNEEPVNVEKSYVKAMVLTSMFGTFGVDRFYLGKIGTGILKLITFGGFGVWTLIDFILTLIGSAREKNKPDQMLDDTEKYKPFFIKLTLVWLAIYAVVIALEVVVFAVTLPHIIDEYKKADTQQSQVKHDLRQLRESQGGSNLDNLQVN